MREQQIFKLIQVQEAVANGDQEDTLKQRCKVHSHHGIVSQQQLSNAEHCFNRLSLVTCLSLRKTRNM